MSNSPNKTSIKDMFANALANAVAVPTVVPTDAQRKARLEEICRETVLARNIKPRVSNRNAHNIKRSTRSSN